MCENCYHEEYGAPTEITENAVAISMLVKRLYQLAPTGGRCHIVTDDWNLDDESLRYCQDCVTHARIRDEQWGLESAVLELMASVPVQERAAGMALAEGFLRLHA